MVSRRAFLGAVALAAAPAWAADDAFARLRRGGFVLLMRHASTEAGLGDPQGYRVGDCSTQRNLSEAGRAEARRVGERLRAARVPIARVFTSPWCRCIDTAQLAFGQAEEWPPLGSFFDAPDKEAEAMAQVKRRIASYAARPPGGNVVMVTHSVNIAGLTQQTVRTGEIVVVRPDGCCGLKMVDRLALA